MTALEGVLALVDCLEASLVLTPCLSDGFLVLHGFCQKERSVVGSQESLPEDCVTLGTIKGLSFLQGGSIFLWG